MIVYTRAVSLSGCYFNTKYPYRRRRVRGQLSRQTLIVLKFSGLSQQEALTSFWGDRFLSLLCPYNFSCLSNLPWCHTCLRRKGHKNKKHIKSISEAPYMSSLVGGVGARDEHSGPSQTPQDHLTVHRTLPCLPAAAAAAKMDSGSLSFIFSHQYERKSSLQKPPKWLLLLSPKQELV